MSNEENINAQITALEYMADVLINEVKALSRSSLFRSGVDISAQKLRVKAQLMRDFHDPIKVKKEGSNEKVNSASRAAAKSGD